MKEKLTVEGVLKDWYAEELAAGSVKGALARSYSPAGTGEDPDNEFLEGHKIVEAAIRRIESKKTAQTWSMHILDGGTLVSFKDVLERERIKLHRMIAVVIKERVEEPEEKPTKHFEMA